VKGKAVLLLIVVLLGLVPVTGAQLEEALRVDRVEYADINTLLSPTGAALIASEGYTVQKLDGSTWTTLGSYKDSTKLDKKVTKDYAAYKVVYEAADYGTKSTVTFTAPESASYRVVWTLSGIDYTRYSEEFMGVNFTAKDHWVFVGWIDTLQQFGEIAAYTVDGDTLTVTFSVGKLAKGESLTLDPILIDSYGVGNYNAELELDGNHPSGDADASALGQSFNATQTIELTAVQFYLMKTGLPTGNAHAVLYAHNGVFGTSSLPTGAALATSDNFDVSTLTGALQLINFTFSGANIYELQAGTQYVIAYQNPAAGIDNAKYVKMGYDALGEHDGNKMLYASGSWFAQATHDTIFYLTATGNTIPENTACDSDTTFNRDNYGWVNVTVDDYPVTDLATVEIQVNTTLDLENFTLRWTQATNTFSEVSDPDNICVLNASISTRINIDDNTDQICFCFNMTGGTSGSCDVTVTTTDDAAATDIDTYNAEFEFSYYNWDDQVYDWIDSAFEQFGLFNYMTQITAYINGLTTYFADSLTHLLALVVQQFRVITNVYNFVIFWITELIGIGLDFSVFYQSVLDGTSGWGLWDFWEVIEYDLWAPAVPLLLFVWWFDSLAKRGAQTVGGELQVFINDMNTAISIISYFVGVFSFVANTIIDRVYGLFDAIV